MGSLSCHRGLERATGHRGPMATIWAGLFSSLLCVGGALFHPVLGYVVFSLETLIPKCSE